jgi:hypothetical protein
MNCNTSSERLRDRVRTIIGSSTKEISANDIRRLTVDASVIADIRECLSSEDKQEISSGLFFLAALLQANPAKIFGEEFISLLVQRIKELVVHESSYVSSQAMNFFVWLKDNYEDYRATMLEAMSSSDIGKRRVALLNYETFAKKDDLLPLISFASDGYVAELSMNGPFRYELRDLALEKLEQIAGVVFRQRQISEPYDGSMVSWYDWNTFFQWLKTTKMQQDIPPA